MDLNLERKIQQLGGSQKMNLNAFKKLKEIYQRNKHTPAGILKYKVKSKRVNPMCYKSTKSENIRKKSIGSKNQQKSLSRKKAPKYKSMKDVYQSFRNLKISKLKKATPKKKRVKFSLENENGILF
jgi:hypothetical protein